MKKLEVVMKPSAFDLFKESATRLGISEYDVSEVGFSPGSAFRERQRLYRGPQYDGEPLARVKVQFVVADGLAKPVAREILALLAPDRIEVSTLDEIISPSSAVSPSRPIAQAELDDAEVPPIIH